MKDFVKMVLASFLAMFLVVLLIAAIIGGIAGVQSAQKPKIKDGSWLVIDLHGEVLPYHPPDDVIAEIFGDRPETLHRILGNLEKAALDDRIAGVIFKVSGYGGLGGASAQEIRTAIGSVRASGKKVYTFAEHLTRHSLFLASACDSIFMPELSDLFFAGYGGTTEHIKRTLDKLGIRPNIHKIDEYKTAAESVLREDMSPEAREMYNWIYDELWDMQIVAIAEGRGIPEDRLVELMQRALFVAEEAKEAGLIDDVMYWDELEKMLKDEDDKKLRTVSQSTYAKVDRAAFGLKGKKKIAVVHAHGTIGGRTSRVDPFIGILMGHQSVRRELRRVRLNDDIAAVVFRIESPGGESVASDLIGHDVEVLAREKPVVVSMVDVAASGGYDIAYRANKIIADPMTITGSIGSIAGKFNTAGFYNKLGITFDHVSKGPNGLFWSPHMDFTDEQWKIFKESHWRSFNIWLEDVAEKRGIDLEELKTLAMGRVWTGRQALENRLIDDVGGLDRAIEVAKQLADIPPEDEVTIVHYPKKKGLFEIITGGGGLKAAIRWVMYRFIQHDLAESMELLMRSAYLNAHLVDE